MINDFLPIISIGAFWLLSEVCVFILEQIPIYKKNHKQLDKQDTLILNSSLIFTTKVQDYLIRHNTDFNVVTFFNVAKKMAVGTFTDQTSEYVLGTIGGQYTKPVYVGKVDSIFDSNRSLGIGLRFNFSF